MKEFLMNISLHAPLYPLDWTLTVVLSGASVVGLVLGLYCRRTLGAFLIWGLVVGFLGSLFVWLIISVLALKWATIVFGTAALLLFAGFYLDEQAPVTGAELVEAAAARNSHLGDLFAQDEEAADSIAATLNLGLDESEPKWGADSMFAGIPKRVTRMIRFMLTIGVGALVVLTMVFLYAVPSPDASDEHVATDTILAQYEETCGELSGIVEERCLLEITKGLEKRINALIGSAETAVLGSYDELGTIRANVPIERWRSSMIESEQQWLQYRDSTCDTLKYLTYLGSGTGRFVATCRLRMTFAHVQRLESYGASYPDYQ